jgi:putative ABC transport system permease protein
MTRSPRRTRLHWISTLIRTTFRRTPSQDLDDEIAAYVDALTRKYVQAGMSPEEAKRTALLETGGVEQLKDNTRDVYPWHGVATFWRDVRYGARSLRRSPGFSAIVIATLAMCIGLTITMFTVVNTVMWRPLPYPNGDRLVVIEPSFGPVTGGLAPGELLAIRNSTRAFTYVGVANGAEAFITFEGQMERVSAASATDDILPLLGAVPMQFGRPLDSRLDLGESAVRSVVLGDRLWRRVFGASADIVGRRVLVNDLEVEVVGVLPPGLRVWLPSAAGVSEDTDVWFPNAYEDDWQGRGAGAIARLAPDVGHEQARAELGGLAARLLRERSAIYANAVGDLTFQMRPLRDVVAEPVERGLLALGVSVVFVLIIGCVNIANLMLARGKSREREAAVRAALGATRLRLFRQLLTENLILAAVGGVAGLVLVQVSIVALDHFGSGFLPRQSAIALDARTMALGMCLAVVIVLGCGMVSALRVSRRRDTGTLISTRSRTSLAGGRRLQRSLVVAQVALAVAPLFGAGLMLQSFRNLTSSPLGFDPSDVVTARVGISHRRFSAPADRWLLYRNIREAVQGLPGVERVSGASPLPFERSDTFRFRSVNDAREPVWATQQSVLPNYLNVVRASLRAGRDFSDDDLSGRRDVAIVDEAFARAMWEGEALGQRFARGSGTQQRVLEVVGVMRRTQVTRVLDAQRTAVRDEALPHVLVPYHIYPVPMTLVARTRPGEQSAATGMGIKRLVEALGVTRAVYDVRPMSSYVQGSIAQSRFSMLVLLVFAATSLLMAAVGVYGTLAYLVSQRTREFALRLALGASARQIAGLVAREGAVLTVTGTMLGVAGAIGVGHLLRTLLYGVASIDAWTMAGVCVVLGAVAVVAVVDPAWRAARVSPRRALEAD